MTGAPAGLTASDLAHFNTFGIDEALLLAAGVRRVTSEEARDAGIRYNSSADLAGILYSYLDPQTGFAVTHRVRRDHPEVDAEGKPIAKYVSGWGDRHHLYFAPDSARFLDDTNVPVVLVEAEKSALALVAAASNADRTLLVVGIGGCWGWRGRTGHTRDASGAVVDEKGALSDLSRIAWQKRDVVICLDSNVQSNPSVQAAGVALAKELSGRGAVVRHATLPADVNGPDDLIALQGGAALMELLDAAVSGKRPARSAAADLMEFTADAELFHTPGGDAYATVPVGNHLETWPIGGRSLARWLRKRAYDATRKPPSSKAIDEAVQTLIAQAQFDGPEIPVHVRVAQVGETSYLDLGNASWDVVEITSTTWRLQPGGGAVKFRRPVGLEALPVPVSGDAEVLRDFMNVPDEDSWRLLFTWLIASLRGRGPYPILALHGEQGSAKSTAARMLRRLVDPNQAPLRSMPKDLRDLAIACQNGWMMVFDNVSGISDRMSDAMCRIATGDSFATRALYTDDEEKLFTAMRPQLLNGIDELGGRADLRDRSITLTLPRILPERRRPERELWAAFEAARPQMLGGLLDVLCAVNATLAATRSADLPRMADFAVTAAAMEKVMGWEKDSFQSAYAANQSRTVKAALEDNVLLVPIRKVLHITSPWSGTATDLLNQLKLVDEQLVKDRRFPKTASHLSNALRRSAPDFRQIGIDVVFDRNAHEGTRLLTLTVISKPAPETAAAESVSPETPSAPSAPSAGEGCFTDPLELDLSWLSRECAQATPPDPHADASTGSNRHAHAAASESGGAEPGIPSNGRVSAGDGGGTRPTDVNDHLHWSEVSSRGMAPPTFSATPLDLEDLIDVEVVDL